MRGRSPRPSWAISTLDAVEGSAGASVFTYPVYKVERRSFMNHK